MAFLCILQRQVFCVNKIVLGKCCPLCLDKDRILLCTCFTGLNKINEFLYTLECCLLNAFIKTYCVNKLFNINGCCTKGVHLTPVGVIKFTKGIRFWRVPVTYEKKNPHRFHRVIRFHIAQRLRSFSVFRVFLRHQILFVKRKYLGLWQVATSAHGCVNPLPCWRRNIPDHMMTSWNGNTFRVTGPLCGEFPGHRWIPLTKASDPELWGFLWYAPEQTV